MNKRNVILFGAGLLVGYLIIKVTNKKTVVSSKVDNLPDISSQTEPPAIVGEETPEVEVPKIVKNTDSPKVAMCKQKWIEFAEKRKFGSDEQAQSTYDNFMLSCVTQS